MLEHLNAQSVVLQNPAPRTGRDSPFTRSSADMKAAGRPQSLVAALPYRLL